MAEDERFERSCRVTATIGLANRAVNPLRQSSKETLAEGRGFEPLRPGSQDITVFKTGALSHSANLPKKWSGRLDLNQRPLGSKPRTLRRLSYTLKKLFHSETRSALTVVC
jgi:hypothetical protein